MKCVIVPLLLLAAAGNISAGVSRHSESSGSYSGSINGKHFGGSYRTSDNGPTTFNHYGDDAARSVGALPDVFDQNDDFDSSDSIFSNLPDIDSDFNQTINQFKTWSNTHASENKPSRRRLISPSSDSIESLAESFSDNFRRRISGLKSKIPSQGFAKQTPISTTTPEPEMESEDNPSDSIESLAESFSDNFRRSISELESFRPARPARPQRVQGISPSRTVSVFPNTEDDSDVPNQRYVMPQQTPISTTTPEPILKSDFPTEAPRTNSNAQFPRDGKPSPLQKSLLEQKLAWDAAQKAKEAASYRRASAVAAIGPGARWTE